MAALAKILIAAYHAICLLAGVTFYAVLQTVFLGADTFMYCFVALMQKQLHVILTHEFRVFYALVALALFHSWLRHAP